MYPSHSRLFKVLEAKTKVGEIYTSRSLYLLLKEEGVDITFRRLVGYLIRVEYVLFERYGKDKGRTLWRRIPRQRRNNNTPLPYALSD